MRTPMSLNLVSIVGLFVMIAALIMLILTDSLFGESLAPIGVQALSLLLMIWARVTFGKRSFHAAATPTDGGLVTSGPYKYVRHPIYAAALYFTWAGILSHMSIVNIFLGICAIGGAVLRMAAEERLVAERYPEYTEYAHRTARVIPFLV